MICTNELRLIFSCRSRLLDLLAAAREVADNLDTYKVVCELPSGTDVAHSVQLATLLRSVPRGRMWVAAALSPSSCLLDVKLGIEAI